jgi:hypothetical protein
MIRLVCRAYAAPLLPRASRKPSWQLRAIARNPAMSLTPPRLVA